MTFLFIHTIGKTKFGGGERWVITAAEGLLKAGHKETILGLPGSKLLKAAEKANIPVLGMSVISDISPWHIMKLRRFLCKNHTDIIITRVTDLFVAGMAAQLLPKTANKPRVIVRHGLPMSYKIRKHLLLHRKLAHGIITNANSIKEEYVRRGYFPPDFVTVVHNGTEIPGDIIPYDFGKQFPGKKIVLSAGRLARQKGYEHLIDAIALLPDRLSSLEFVVLGTGKRLNSLKRRAARKKVEHRIHFWGFIDDIKPCLAGCDLFVLPSLYEGMPNAVMEAMALGKPVVASHVNGVPELINDNTTGLTVPPGRPEALAKAITLLMDDPILRQQMGSKAAQRIARDFSVKKMISRLEKEVEVEIKA